MQAVLRAVGSTAALVAIYYVLPLDRSSTWVAVTMLAIGLAWFIGLVVYQVRWILRSRFPGLRGSKPVGTYPARRRRKPTTRSSRTCMRRARWAPTTRPWSPRTTTARCMRTRTRWPTRHGGWGGAAVGALIGCLFPPAFIAATVTGAAMDAVSGHLWRGMSRADCKELGDIIDDGQAALVIVGESKVAEAVDKAGLKAEKQVAKELDVKPKDIDKAVQRAAGEVS